jgi:hypothetical protein
LLDDVWPWGGRTPMEGGSDVWRWGGRTRYKRYLIPTWPARSSRTSDSQLDRAPLPLTTPHPIVIAHRIRNVLPPACTSPASHLPCPSSALLSPSPSSPRSLPGSSRWICTTCSARHGTEHCPDPPVGRGEWRFPASYFTFRYQEAGDWCSHQRHLVVSFSGHHLFQPTTPRIPVI